MSEQLLADRLYESFRREEQITLILGSGIGADATPGVADVLRLAEQYAVGRSDGGDLTRMLALARVRRGEGPPSELYTEYRRIFANWVGGDGFDVIAQQAVLEKYRPPDRLAGPLATHGLWQRVTAELGEDLENDLGSWMLSPAVEALGAVLAGLPGAFDNRVLTTNFDPQLEIAIRTASGRAITTPLDVDGRWDRDNAYDGAVRVFHLHGFWRPVVAGDRTPLVHDPSRFTRKPTIGPVADLITGETVCVIGSSDWAGTITSALVEVAQQRPVTVLWALHPDDPEGAARRCEQLRGEGVARVECFAGVDAERLLSGLAARLGVTVVPRAAGPRHRHRHPVWEGEFVSHPASTPPDDFLGLIRQLERRFGWQFAPADTGTPSMIFWPVRLRARTSVIHMAQALVAGALAARGASLLVCLDDFGIRDPRVTGAAFEADLRRWIGATAPGLDVEFVSLSDFIRLQRESPSPEHLLRPVDPWTVARDFYGEHNPSLYSVLASIKAVPNVAAHELEPRAWEIVQALLRRNTNRLLTPMTMWAYLHHLLLDRPAHSIMTLGTRDDALFWQQWREMYRFGIAQLYNPHISSLTHKSEMLRWDDAETLREHLTETCAVPGWDGDGRYVSWLLTNAVLLPNYLTGAAPPETGGHVLDSWADFMAALDGGAPALAVLADQATLWYRGQSGPSAVS
ncbi:SIR2 family protein [Catenuloplanes atrovinosus]|uniref:SIR2-like domain-containing protein n=1 Tax=Catenuloplanes atrovinosus TaxID=137266 RepID=A0AAE4CB38_9ACTN|nr:SIR2 family protein [Catenuloplanes atrovinosus]MDR7276449.1 hypothetical protein [Catenuloplanes atrovinosus]